MLEVGNSCYVDNDYTTLWLIIDIVDNVVFLKNVKNGWETTKITKKRFITEIIEN